MSDDIYQIKWLKEAAERGDPRAQRQFGQRYLEGEGLEKDLEKAEMWLKMAAEQGEAEAQYCLAAMFNKKRDPEEQYKLGMMHLDGKGVKKSIEEATKLIRSSAEGGYAAAQNTAGSELYAAVTLIKLAAEMQGDDKIPGLLEESIKAIKEADNMPDFRMKNDLGIMLLEGTDIKKSEEKAAEWLEQAARQGNPYAQYNLASLHARNRRLVKAYSWICLAANSGYEHIVSAKKKIERDLEPYHEKKGLDMKAAKDEAKKLAEEIKNANSSR